MGSSKAYESTPADSLTTQAGSNSGRRRAVSAERSTRPQLAPILGSGSPLVTVTAARPPEVTGSDLLHELAGLSEGARILRTARPEPAVAFGRLDVLRPGYDAARAAALAGGFTPVVREVGGHAAAYDHGCLVVELVGREEHPRGRTMGRFEAFTGLLATALFDIGVDARIGEVPREYCPGRFSINARGVTKLVGIAQRVTTRGWLLSAVVTVRDAEAVRRVVPQVYDALDLPLDPQTVGAIADELGDVGVISVADVERALVAAFLSAADDVKA